ncbi:hypothetical protein XELAEV_18013603mg [Xenopus laevis]|uniref:Uncharacterized protein n=1 Tax=Xenopus laevis TaxID=8355 RepID=A0A974HZB5_XENLA|nr:hypothetical protein XELAEV_18013603mg [Xenopus laevis]
MLEAQCISEVQAAVISHLSVLKFSHIGNTVCGQEGSKSIGHCGLNHKGGKVQDDHLLLGSTPPQISMKFVR